MRITHGRKVTFGTEVRPYLGAYCSHVLRSPRASRLIAALFIGLAAAGASLAANDRAGLPAAAVAATRIVLPAPHRPRAEATFTPQQVPNLAAWYDASNPNTISLYNTTASAWLDLSGNGNGLAQTSAQAEPAYGTGIDRRGNLTFSGSDFLTSANPTLSNSLFPESTVFVVANQSVAASSGNLLGAGAYPGGPAYSLRLSDGGAAHFDFGNTTTGRGSPSRPRRGAGWWPPPRLRDDVHAHAAQERQHDRDLGRDRHHAGLGVSAGRGRGDGRRQSILRFGRRDTGLSPLPHERRTSVG